MEKLRLGLIGAGAIAESHATGIRQSGRAELAAVCKRSEKGRADIEKKYSVPCFTRMEDILPLVDAVDIITPSGSHLEQALAAMEAGKHVLVEKPMEITTARIDSMIEAARRHGVVLACVFQLRYKEITRRAKKLIDGGILGEIYGGSAYCKLYRTQEYYDSGGWRGTLEMDGGGCLMNQGIHNVDFLLWFMGDVEEVIGTAETKGRKNIEVETMASALLKFRSGARGTLESTTLAYPGAPERLEIFGSRGTLIISADNYPHPDRINRLDLIDPSPAEEKAREELLSLQGDQPGGEERPGKDTGTVVTAADQGHGPVIEDFAEAVLEGRQPLVPGAEARRSVELIAAVYESAKNGSRPVKLG